ncbi:hypothetical protein ILYODFUR_019675 [Ilyodon furcidens]|uniref:Uncharacterized protein n=1 Tax=Ilyodon furcidens TaxID=33524 RepID=A0ABV0U738_9TELE
MFLKRCWLGQTLQCKDPWVLMENDNNNRERKHLRRGSTEQSRISAHGERLVLLFLLLVSKSNHNQDRRCRNCFGKQHGVPDEFTSPLSSPSAQILCAAMRMHLVVTSVQSRLRNSSSITVYQPPNITCGICSNYNFN